MERFWNKVRKTDGCWEWIGKKNWAGYGMFQGKRAHRFCYELIIGEIPKGRVICHTCDNPACVRPSHLFCGTMKDNMQDMTNKGRRASGSKVSSPGEKNPRAKVGEKEVKEIRGRYKDGTHTQAELAEMFGLGKTTVAHIVHRRSWKNI